MEQFVIVPTKRHAKRWAYTHTALVIEYALNEGWIYHKGYCREAADKLYDAVWEIVQYLKKYGLLADDPVIKYEFSELVGSSPENFLSVAAQPSETDVDSCSVDLDPIFRPVRKHRKKKKRKGRNRKNGRKRS